MAEDSTVDGQFPSEFGSSGGGGGTAEAKRADPPAAMKVQGGKRDQFAFGQEPRVPDYSIVDYPYQGPSPVLRIDGDKLGTDLSGVYRFTTPYMFTYGTVSGASIATQVSGSATQTGLAKFTIPSGNYLMDLLLYGDVGPNGTGTLSANGFNLAVNTQSPFDTDDVYGTVYMPSFSISNYNSITSGQSITADVKASPLPAYEFEFVRSTGGLDNYGVAPVSGGSATAQLSFSASTTTSLNIAVGVNAKTLQGIDTAAIGNTLKSSL